MAHLRTTDDPFQWVVRDDSDQEVGSVLLTGGAYLAFCRFCDRLPGAWSTAYIAGRKLVEHAQEETE